MIRHTTLLFSMSIYHMSDIISLYDGSLYHCGIQPEQVSIFLLCKCFFMSIYTFDFDMSACQHPSFPFPTATPSHLVPCIIAFKCEFRNVPCHAEPVFPGYLPSRYANTTNSPPQRSAKPRYKKYTTYVPEPTGNLTSHRSFCASLSPARSCSSS